MKNFIFLILFCPFFSAFLPLSAQNSLYMGDPRNSWWREWGSMEEVTVTTKPQGAYIECGLYITFSAKGTQWYNRADSLEISYKFELPEGSVVYDSWLWIGNDIIKAKILDRWTASAIYEGYVKRRTDPSILFKNGDNQYELKIFPMAGNQKRRVKISYLVPATWSRDRIRAALPIPALRASRLSPKLVILAWQNAHGKAPELPLMSGALTNQNAAQPEVFQGNFANWNFPSDITYDSPAKKGYYLSTYEHKGENFYQVSFLPGFLTNVQKSKKIAFLFDYDAAGSTITDISRLLSTSKFLLRQYLNETDSFNLIFSNLNIQRASEHWMPATYANVEAAFVHAEKQLSSYSNFSALVLNGIQFVRQQGGKGQLLLMSNASQFCNLQVANTLLNDMMAQMPPAAPVPIHTVSYYDRGQVYMYVNGTYYYANEYLLGTLSAMTKGNAQNVQNKGFDNALTACLNNTESNIEAFDFHTKLADGFCYGRFYPQETQEVVFANSAVVQIGKYKGDFPFEIEISGELDGQVLHGEISVPRSEVTQGDSLLREMWFGHYIGLLEADRPENNIIQEIISTSMKERVLSRYTAFFCPEDTSLICRQCLDETKLTGTSVAILPDSSLMAWPNPFRETVTLVIQQSPGAAKDAQLDIMTIDGRLVQTFSISAAEGKTTIEWDGNDAEGGSTGAGVYLAILKTGHKTKVLKLIRTGD